MEDPDISPHTYGYLIFDKEIRTAPWKRQHLQPMVLVMLHGCVQKIPRKVSSRHNRTSSPRLAAHIKPTQVQARQGPSTDRGQWLFAKKIFATDTHWQREISFLPWHITGSVYQLYSRVDGRSSFASFWLFLSCWFLSYLFCISLLLYERKSKRKI